MKLFTCQSCGQLLFFESVQCIRCKHPLAYLPDHGVMSALEPSDQGAQSGQGEKGRWRALAAEAAGTLYRACANGTDHGVCNWAIADDDVNPLCRACRLNHMIPNLSDPQAKEAWHRVEIAKRRLLYTLFGLGLPLSSKAEEPDKGLAFDFLQPDAEEEPVMTGHHDGTITINVAEADDPFREKMRQQLGETYRTVLGHFRHESGHYYWQRLLSEGPMLESFRVRFGDERASYDEAVERHYKEGAPADWAARFVSPYASMHPWEDFAETWAHYLHMVDGLETARAHGLSLRPDAPGPRGAGAKRTATVAVGRLDLRSFDDLMKGWNPLTTALNNMNRSFGTAEPYPFILAPAAVDKLRFVHDLVEAETSGTRA